MAAILHTSQGYRDYLGNTSLKLMPVELGDDVELRCTKILERNQSDVIETAACSDASKFGCEHRWSRTDGSNAGRVISPLNHKYKFSEIATDGYCATFEDTSANYKALNLSGEPTGYKCLVSTMTIISVQKDDLGTYMCNFSDHITKTTNGRDPTIDLTEVVLAGTKKQAKEVIHEELHSQGRKDQLLIQCVVTGGKVRWMIQPYIEDGYEYCGYQSSSTSGSSGLCSEKYVTIEELAKTDYWRCYNITVVYTNPYQDVSESLIGVKNTCEVDYDKVVCTVDGYVAPNKYHSMVITERNVYYDVPYRYYGNDLGIYLSIICIPILFGLLLIGFTIWAVVRGRVCGRRRQYSLAMLPQQSQVLSVPQPQQVSLLPQPQFYQQQHSPGFNLQLPELAQIQLNGVSQNIYESVDRSVTPVQI